MPHPNFYSEFSEALQSFLQISLDDALARRSDTTPVEVAWNFATKCAATVPAYADCLTCNGIDVEKRQPDSFYSLPVLTRENYINQYPLKARCTNGDIHSCNMAAVSSGSTGTPTVWPRSAANELQVARRFEQVFADSFDACTRSTLAVICFAMGTWVGGLYSLDCCRHLTHRGMKVFAVAPGANLNEILRIVNELGPQFDQTVLLGYPPFLKDVVDEGISRGINWREFHVKCVCAGEVFSEEWRSLMAGRLGTSDDAFCSASIYGTADAGVLACETPLSITIRRWFANNPAAAERLFGESRLPALFQYDPYHRFFECIDHELLFTGDNGVPLVRYNIHDSGGLLEFRDMTDFLYANGFNILAVAQQTNITVRDLPFVWVFGRSNFTVSFYGANIYPENVTVALELQPICNWVTGKFVLHIDHDPNGNSNWVVEVELAVGTVPPDDLADLTAATIRSQLSRLNSEFAHYVPEAAQLPIVHLRPYRDGEWFPAGVKHRYTRR